MFFKLNLYEMGLPDCCCIRIIISQGNSIIQHLANRSTQKPVLLLLENEESQKVKRTCLTIELNFFFYTTVSSSVYSRYLSLAFNVPLTKRHQTFSTLSCPQFLRLKSHGPNSLPYGFSPPFNFLSRDGPHQRWDTDYLS